MGKRKKRRKRVSRYKGIKLPSMNAAAMDETPAILRKEFPQKLIDTFVAVCLSDWSDKQYKKYAKQAESFLGKVKYEDKIISGTLVVKLSKACRDLTDTNKKAKNLAMKMTCKVHPKYKAMRTPRSGCERCWDIYNGKKTVKKTAKKAEKKAKTKKEKST